MASMNDGSLHGSSVPRACAAAMTSVAASSTTLNPSSSNWRMIAVLPAPGAPVMMNRLTSLPFENASVGAPHRSATNHEDGIRHLRLTEHAGPANEAWSGGNRPAFWTHL